MIKNTHLGSDFQDQIESIRINLNVVKERVTRFAETGLQKICNGLDKVSFTLTFFVLF